MLLRKRILCHLLLFPFLTIGQNTTGSIQGSVKMQTGEVLAGATVKLFHEPTGTVYLSKSSAKGNYYLNNIHPGGPYKLEASFIGYHKEFRTALFISIGDEAIFDFALIPQSTVLTNITVMATQKTANTGIGSSTSVIGKEKIDNLPSVGRNIYDYLKAVPQAKLISSNEGAVSFSGQNNRYNSFYVDGAINNDVFGLSSSGTNGGQAGIAPLSLDAIDQFQVALSLYDVSVGNFTGASINAVTRSGSNKTESSVYHFFSNNHLSGRTTAQTNSNQVDRNDFATHTSGTRLQGAITQNKCFYFINMEIQRDRYPKPFLISQYSGDTRDPGIIRILANTLRATYQYDAGSFLDNPETVHADRLVTRLDWNLGKNAKLSVSNRYTNGQRTNSNAGNNQAIYFSNNGFLLNTITNSTSLEWRKMISGNKSNKLLITFTSVTDDRGPLGKAFPRVRINDGTGAIIFGTDNSSTINLLTQKNWTLLDKLNVVSGKHILNMGMEAEYNIILNAFIQNSFGSYSYASLGDFLTNAHPSAYQLGFPLQDHNNNDHTNSSARFSIIKFSLFATDAIRLSSAFLFHYGIRADYYRFLNQPQGDDYINRIAIPAFSHYWDVQGARSGAAPNIPVSISPGMGFTYHLPGKKWVLRGGAGFFSGRIPLAWPGGIYNNNGVFAGGYIADMTQLNKIRFRPDPYRQWTPVETGASVNKEPLNLMTANFRMPKLFRASVSVDKNFRNGWSLATEVLLNRNLNEIYYTNINLLPPTQKSSGPDKRNVYSIVNKGKIPLNPDGSNPYDYAILLGNNKGEKGYAQSFTTKILKQTNTGWNLEINYTLGKSIAITDGTASVNVSQWRFTETVNGRNFPSRSVSDFSTGHRIFAWLSRRFFSIDKKHSFTLSLTYTGQSGSPFSFVYGNGSMTRDDGVLGGYDLIYVPTHTDLVDMVFLSNNVNGIFYTPQQQKDAFESYILMDSYLKKRRGKYAERNGSQTPFTNKVDLKLKQDIEFRIRSNHYHLQLSFDIFNLGNLINQNWGRQYIIPFDNYALLSFAGYTDANNFIPQYRFDPTLLHKTPWNINIVSVPAYSSFWSGQIGVRLTIN